MEAPTDVTGVKSFLGHIKYYRRFIKNIARISYPMDRLTRKGESYAWTKEQEEAFEDLKTRLLVAPILALPNWDKEFHVHVDASNYPIGATLAQEGGHGLDHPIYFASRLLSNAEKNCSTTEREALGMVCSIVQNIVISNLSPRAKKKISANIRDKSGTSRENIGNLKNCLNLIRNAFFLQNSIRRFI